MLMLMFLLVYLLVSRWVMLVMLFLLVVYDGMWMLFWKDSIEVMLMILLWFCVMKCWLVVCEMKNVDLMLMFIMLF